MGFWCKLWRKDKVYILLRLKRGLLMVLLVRAISVGEMDRSSNLTTKCQEILQIEEVLMLKQIEGYKRVMRHSV